MLSQSTKKSYLIVGQGIAGSLLAWHLMKAGHQALIVDDNHHSSSSIISAGIINPITGQRLSLTPHFDLFLKHAFSTYAQLSVELGINFFVPKPIIRVLRNQEELERCSHLINTPSCAAYIKGIHKSGHYGPDLHDPFGSMTITQGGYLQTEKLLHSLREYFINKNMLINERLRYDDVKISDHHVTWHGQKLNALICCEGFKANENPWFKNLPFNLAKGEIARIAFESVALPDAILCQQQWCLPQDDGSYLVGATYDRDNINTSPTAHGQATILKGLNNFIPAKVRVIESRAGVRPVMLDGKPIIGLHPTNLKIGIFNGFASKGMLWAPYYAENFAKELVS